MGVLKLFEGTGDLFCAIATIKTPEGVIQKVVDGAAFSVGRAPDCVLSIPDVGISRLHMLVTIKRGEVYITDQGSSNGTFLNGQKVEAKRLIHVKATDELKLGKSEVVLQFGCVEKHFKTDYIAESLLPPAEKDNLMGLIKASHHKAQEIVGMAQTQADQLVQVANEKARTTENQTLLMQEDILSKAQVESQHIISETKRKAAQMIVEAEDNAKEATKNIHVAADQRKNEAEEYYKSKIQEAKVKGEEIIAQHAQMGKDMIEELRQKTIEKTEKDAKEQLSSLFKLIEEKSDELDKLQKECEVYRNTKKYDIDKELEELKAEFYKKFDFEKQTSIDNHHSHMAMLEAEFLHKKKELEEAESKKIQDVESRYRSLNERLDTDYAEKRVRFEREYTEKTVSLEKEYALKQGRLEDEYQNRQSELSSDYEKNREELNNTLDKQRKSLEKEVESQRQNLMKIQAELENYSAEHLELKSKVEDLRKNQKGLEKNEADTLASIQQKRAELDSMLTEEERVSAHILECDAKLKTLQTEYASLKETFEEEKEKLKTEHERELQKSRAELAKRTQDYSDQEKMKFEEYKSHLLNERKQMDINFERSKKEFEIKTREMIEFEKTKLEENKQQFLSILNQQRNIVITEVTKAIVKIEKRGEPSSSIELVAKAVEGVFDSHVAELSLSTHTTNTIESSRNLKAKWLSYGVGATLSFVLAFTFLIQPQINRHVAGTAENLAAVPKERPKYQRDVTTEMRDSYVDSILYTQRYAEIFLDEQLQDKWFKMVSTYMFETWRVPEEKTIEVVAISKSLVSSLEARVQGLDAEFAQPGIEKMHESEADAIMRMGDILGTQVKFEAFKRKEKEFFEPYILNQ